MHCNQSRLLNLIRILIMSSQLLLRLMGVRVNWQYDEGVNFLILFALAELQQNLLATYRFGNLSLRFRGSGDGGHASKYLTTSKIGFWCYIE